MRFSNFLGTRAFRFIGVAVIAALLVGVFFQSNAQAAPPSFVQAASVVPAGNGNTMVKAFTNPNTAGDLIVAAATWDASASGGAFTCTDSQGNAYVTAATQLDSANDQWLGVCYAANVKSGANTVTATLSANRPFRRMVIHEYAGVAANSPVDVVAKSAAAGSTAANAITSTAATTTTAGDLIFGAVMDTSSTTSITAGTGFTQRGFTNNKDLATQDMIKTAAGSVASTQTFGAAHRYDAIMVAFKPATQVPDTTAPSAPTNLTAATSSSSQVNVSWSASTDNVGVTGYRVERCQGTGCSNFAEIATPTAVTYSDSGLASSTAYSYRVRATDAAGNLSGYSPIATATTQGAPDTIAPSVPANLAGTGTSFTQVNLTWTASTDNVGVAGYKIFRDGAQINTSTSTTFNDSGLAAGTSYSYTVAAYDAAGNSSAQSSPVNVSTQSDTTAPAISMTAPASGTTVSGTVTVSANASDAGSGVHDVQFFLEGNPLGASDTTAPYSVSWDTTTTPNNVYHLTAVAKDNVGNISNTSGAFTVTVNNQVSQLPVDLMAGWPFSESTGTTTADVTSYGNTASFNSLSSPTWAAGKYGSGVHFSGSTSDYLTVNDSPTMDVTGTALTLSMWIYPAGGTSHDQVPFGKFWNGTGGPYYQYGLELDRGDTPHFWIGTTAGTAAGAAMGSALPVGQWSHLAVVYNGSYAAFYVNGNLISTPSLTGSIADRQGSTILIGNDIGHNQGFVGSLDDVRLYKRVLTQSAVQADMNTPLVNSGTGIGPAVAITAPTQNAQVSNIFTITADASDETVGVQFYVDGTVVGPEDTAAPFGANWDTRASANGAHTLTARARDAAGKTTVSNPVTANVVNGDSFQNEILATGFNLPTAMKFLPDGRMLVAELTGKILIVPAPYTTPSPTPFMTIPDIGTSATSQEGIFDFALDPNFATNHYYYVFYTVNNGHDRLARFTANATLDGTIAGSMQVFYEDTVNIPSDEHHGGGIAFSNDGKIFFTTGEHFQGAPAQDLNSPWGKVHRLNLDGSVPTDNPFYDGAGPHVDSIYALGLRNPYRAYFDSATNRLLVGDVGGNEYNTAYEEVDNITAGGNYGWPNCEFGTCGNSAYTPALYAYAHQGRDASVTGGFVYHAKGAPGDFPSGFEGSYFFGDYAQNWIKRLTFDAQGNTSGVSNFEPMSGVLDGPYGDIVYLTEGPDGSLYYIDLGYSDVSGTFGTSKIHRIRYQSSNQAPTAVAGSDVTSGPTPLTVNFNSTGSADPESQPLTYSWDFGDGTPLSTAANPSHTYTTAGNYSVRLTVSDGVNSTFAPPINIQAGSVPTATILTPTDGGTFRAGDVISYSGAATDPDDGNLPASAYSWTIDFLHEGHVHPGSTATGVTSGSFTIPTTGHDFSGNTRYRITLTVTDSTGLTSSKSVIVWPQKVNLTFDTAPTGTTLYLDGIAKTTPFVYDTLIGFNHTIEARNTTVGNSTYTFASWSDGGAQTHTVVVPAADQSYVATYTVTTASTGAKAAWGFNEASGSTSADSSGNSNTATLVGAITRVAGPTGHGNALSFSGSGQYITAPNSTSLDIAGNALTLSAWVNPSTTSSGDQVLIGKHWNTTMTSPYYQYGVELQNNGAKPVFQIGTASGVQAVAMSTSLTKGTWSYLTIVWNGSTVSFYVNGTLVNTANLSATMTARGNPLRIGADANTQQFYKGSLDDLRIYNRAQTPAEIQADMNTSL
jgi:glucose/arabinose dehydrogenase/chitodextrinase